MIHYIGYYSDGKDERELNVAPSAITKMNYIVSVLLKNGNDVKLFSPAYSRLKKFHYFSKKRLKISSHYQIQYASTFGTPNIFLKVMAKIFMEIQIFTYLMFDVAKNDIVLVYHSKAYSFPIRIYNIFRKNKLVFEIEELYAAAWKNKVYSYKNEIKYLSIADSYIYVNDIMNNLFQFHKPYTVCYGNYDMKIENKNLTPPFNTLIYAGVIGEKDSDVYLAVDIMNYLPLNYKLKIAGYGSENNVERLKETIAEKSNIKYYGCLKGKEYEEFLLDGDIGLCTRVLDNDLSNYTFPSKVLVYLSHGLIPLTTNIDCISKSKIKDYVIIAKNNDPKCIASLIIEMDLKNNKSSVEILKKLDDEFSYSLKKLLKDEITTN